MTLVPVFRRSYLKQSMLAVTVAAVMSLGSLSGCTNIQDDSTRTKTEGTLVGAGLGAALGAAIGAIAGKGKGAAIGAAIGLGVGSLAGFFVGKHIADRKAEYASEEDWLDACIEDSEKKVALAKEQNEKLSAEISKTDQEAKQLQAQYRRGQVSRESMLESQQNIKKMRSDLDKDIASLQQEVGREREIAADARSSGNLAKAKQMDREIQSLQQQINQMKKNNQKLANISTRLSV